MEESKTANSYLIKEIKDTFNELLFRHLCRIKEISSHHSSLPIHLSHLAGLLLIVERDLEIKAYPQTTQKHFDRETIRSEMVDLGANYADDIGEAFCQLINTGYVSMDDQGRYMALEPAFSVARAIDGHFPQMPGMSLLVYIIQGIEEVVSGRKELDFAIRQTDQTLMSRAVSFKSRVHSPPQKSNKISKQKKADFIKRIRQRFEASPQEISDPVILTRGQYARDVKITELFPKSKSEEDNGESFDSNARIPEKLKPSANDSPAETHEDKRTSFGKPEADLPKEEPDDIPDSAALPDAMFQNSDSVGIEVLPSVVSEPDATEGESGTETKEAEEVREQENSDDRIAENTENEQTSELIIDNQINEFETKLALMCPICKTGHIEPKATESGKTYYMCSGSNCNFISWGKPYHFPCPRCRNSFLIEFKNSAGVSGLKCPRATCTFRQDHLDAPLSNSEIGSREAPAVHGSNTKQTGTKKRKRVVRRRIVRKKR